MVRFVADPRGPGEAASASALEGCTLLIPSVSAGNVGQLAADLAVAGLTLVRLGWLDDPENCVLPVAGADAYNAPPPGKQLGTLNAGIEVFGHAGGVAAAADKVCVVQIRAPVAPGMRGAFASGLAGWATSVSAVRVVVLASATPEGGQARDGGTPKGLGFGSTLVLASPAAADVRAALEDVPSAAILDGPIDELGLREGSLAVRLFRCLSERDGLPVTLFATLVADGDNIPDACSLVSIVSGSLCLGIRLDARPPPSWAALYGSGPDVSLY